MTDPDGAIQWEQDSNSIGEFPSVLAYQAFAEWPIVPMTIDSFTVDATDTNSTTQGKPANMGFTVNYPTYAGDTQTSQTYLVDKMQAFRVPADPLTPYDLSNIGGVGWGKDSCVSILNPTGLIHNGSGSPDYTVPLFYNNAVYGNAAVPVAGSSGPVAPLAGGLQNLIIPYNANDPNRMPLATPFSRSFNGIRSVFSYSEYLWSTVWAHPIVLNAANLNYTDASPFDPNFPADPYLGEFSHFRFSQPAAWPKFVQATGIIPDNSQFDMTAVGGPAFNAASPVAVNTPATPPSSTGVGRFYWTAYTPSYNSASGGVISRTWLALDNPIVPGLNDKPPTTFSGAASGDATAAFGFVPPQDTVVDKRGRNADGTLNGQASGGYRVTWYNATLDANGSSIAGSTVTPGNPVPPDFWVVELVTSASNSNPAGGTIHFMLPGNFPAPGGNPAVQTQQVNSLVLTDARTYLPSGNSFATGPATSSGVVTDQVAPGYCWFDVPLELRPVIGTQARVTVFALKAILKNNPVAGAKALNRTDWIDAVKTATAQISVVAGSGFDVSYAHKVPFNYPWDIVVVNGPATTVAQ
jgi:hypothetical protein